jgi:ParB family chromosome partitioning protein
VKAYISAGEISAGAARMLVAAPDPEGMARQIVERGLNVRQVEALAKERARKPAKSAASGANKSADTAALEQRLSDTLGLTVTLAERGNRGVLHIHFRSLDQLEDVVRRLEKN